MNLHFKFVKPVSFFAAPDELSDALARFNEIGSKSWDKSFKDDIGFEEGDISKRARLKKIIKIFLTKQQQAYCYYCGRSFYLFGENPKMYGRYIHIDHILPKNASHGHYGRFVFEPKNLILACAICNGIDYKGTKDFCATPTIDYDHMSFSIVHPYFDDISLHFRIEDDGRAIKINEDISKAELMEEVFRINSTYMIEGRLQNLQFIRQNLSQNEEDEISLITNSIPIDGVSAI
ncbi:HNH endonuclease [Pantoea dispersa]|uniref:HNH endonuclease n=1 Tax=Pantoea dispersa TaxID=59814 RepID=UPI0021F77749|nr:HNH endonuclease [Pantoea dispersa]MCW0322562.1 hypothetical protein [Pantoea dispersa]MCW0327484.1 hypothetical protein [Pantoea dispersa]MCW0433909.1 hypothetical protein [Pantoea dispersa]